MAMTRRLPSEERLALVCALLAVLLLAVRARTLAVLAACGGILFLVLAPPPLRCAACRARRSPEHYPQGGEAVVDNKEDNKASATMAPPSDPQVKTPVPAAPPLVPPPVAVVPAVADGTTTTDDRPPEEDVDDDELQLFIADHVGTLPYARFMRQTPALDGQGLMQQRTAPPPPRGRDRLARIVPIPTQSGYNNRPFSNSKFAHLR